MDAQSCLTLCNPMDHSPPGSSILGIFQARILELGCHSLLQGVFPYRAQTWVSCTEGIFFTTESPGKQEGTPEMRITLDFPGGSDGKESACNAGDPGLIHGWGRHPGEGNGNPLQYSCLENPKDGGAWRTTVPGVAQSQTRLSYFHFHEEMWSSSGEFDSALEEGQKGVVLWLHVQR